MRVILLLALLMSLSGCCNCGKTPCENNPTIEPLKKGDSRLEHPAVKYFRAKHPGAHYPKIEPHNGGF